MPQQLTSLGNYSGYAMGVGKLGSNSRAACIIADCISTWSYLDVQLGCILGALLGVNSDAAIEIFMNIRKSGRQIELLGIAKNHSKLLSDPETMIRFRAIIRTFESLEKTRNKFAHGCFGDMDGNPNLILWCEAKDYVLMMTTFLPKIHTGQLVKDPHKDLLDKILVYTIQELEKILNSMKNIEEFSNVFYCHLLNPSHIAYIEAVNLCSDYPVIKDSIEFIRSNGKT